MHHKYNTRGAENATMSDDLKIKPEFRDLIPKLTDEEFAQLEENILEDGEVREPIIVWNGFIVDGHHRWYIIQKHPDIPYKVREMGFDNEHAAMAWACANQLGRRNLPSADHDYLVGTQYAHEKMARSAPLGNQNAKKQVCSSDRLVSGEGETAERIAKEHGMKTRKVYDDSLFAQGVDIAEGISPGMKDGILQGDINVTKKIVRKIPKADASAQKKAVELISQGDAHRAEIVLDGDGDIVDGMYDDGEDVGFTEDDLMQELETNFDNSMDSLKTTRKVHNDILADPAINNKIIDFLISLHEAEIIELRKEKL